MKLFWKLVNSLIFAGVTLPLLVLGFLAALVWCGLQCGWFWGHKWVEWTFEAPDSLTWKMKVPLQKGGSDSD